MIRLVHIDLQYMNLWSSDRILNLQLAFINKVWVQIWVQVYPSLYWNTIFSLRMTLFLNINTYKTFLTVIRHIDQMTANWQEDTIYSLFYTVDSLSEFGHFIG